MNWSKLDSNVPGKWLAPAIISAVGLLLLATVLGAGLQRWAFDLLFVSRPAQSPPEAVIVYMDEPSFVELGQPLNVPWSRALHANFLRRMKEVGAKAVVFDIVFSDKGVTPEAAEEDAELASAIKSFGKVFLGADKVLTTLPNGQSMYTLVPPTAKFMEAGATSGLVSLLIDPDYGIRRQVPAPREEPTLAYATAVGIGRTPMADPLNERLWINYYGPPGAIKSTSYYQAMTPNALKEDFFKDKVVFVGQKLMTDLQSKLKDDFATPYTWTSRKFSPGVEIQATAYLNLIRAEHLRRFPLGLEVVLVLIFGCFSGLAYHRRTIRFGIILAVATTLVLALLSVLMFRLGLWWWAWTIPAVQTGAGLAFGVAAISRRNYREKQRMMASLEKHLSPARVKQLIDDPALLAPGGKEMEVSVMFSDIEGFSKMSESKPPKELFDLLNQYYDCALGAVFKHDGMVVSLIGDAIMAIWNAPNPQSDHHLRASLAAIELHQKLLEFDRQHAQNPMRTRVGVHTAVAVVGNLGSKDRFQFTAIGHAVNLASRLEGLNKKLGTSVLVSGFTHTYIKSSVASRYVGEFIVKGIRTGVEVYELLGPLDWEPSSKIWRDLFNDAMFHYRRGNLKKAQDLFTATIEARRQSPSSAQENQAGDGPSKFYLDQIKVIGLEPPEGFTGAVTMDEK